MSTLKDQLEADLRDAMKARDELITSTLRMAIAAVRTAEVAGKQARELSDDEVLAVLTKEAKKRREAADAFADAGRAEPAEQGAGRGGDPRPLPAGAARPTRRWPSWSPGRSPRAASPAMAQMGPAMKAAQAAVAGRAEGGRVAAEVRRQLAA